MNERFFLLPAKRQEQILNAAYKSFASSSYDKASMSEIAGEARISKSLLFHYFQNKAELFQYLWDHAMQRTSEAILEYQVWDSRDLFEMLRRSLKGKCALMRQYPYISLFILMAYYEKSPEVAQRIQGRFLQSKLTSYQAILAHLDPACIRADLSMEEIYQQLIFASDGYLLDAYRQGRIDPDRMEREYDAMICFWKKAYGRTDT